MPKSDDTLPRTFHNYLIFGTGLCRRVPWSAFKEALAAGLNESEILLPEFVC